MIGNYIKVIGIKFDVLEGLQVVNDMNASTFEEAALFIDKVSDGNTIFIGIPCTYEVKSSSHTQF